MKDKMKAWYQTGLLKQEEREIDSPIPHGNQVQVKVGYTGICGSDLHYFEHGQIGDYIVKYPFVLGHESAGIVTAVGEDVTDLKIGDRVAMEPGYTCGKCEFCKTGRYNLCPDVVFFATPPYHGTLAEYVVHPQEYCFKLPDEVSEMEGALIEPLAVGFHAIFQGGAKIGQSAMITGCGAIGLVTMLALKSMGVHEIYMSDVIDTRIQKAGSLGAKRVFNAGKEDVVKQLLKETGGEGVDLVIETAGNPVSQAQCVDLVRKGGVIVFVGMAPASAAEININQLISKEATIKTVFRYRNLYPTAIAAVAAGLPLKDIVSDIYPFSQTDLAFEKNINNKADIIKTVIEY